MTELQYISVTGNTWFELDQYFISNYSVEIENVTFTIEGSTNARHSQLFAGGSGDWPRIGSNGSNIYFTYDYDNNINSSLTALTGQTVLMTDQGVWVDGTQIGTYTVSSASTKNSNMILFANTSSGGDSVRNQTASVGKITIKDSANTIVAQYIPSIDEVDDIGYYNPISETFITKNGTGTPIAGPVAHTFNVNPTSLSFAAAGGSQTFTLDAETGWTCTTIPTGFTLSTTAGTSGQTTITVSTPSYTGSTNKTETAVFTDDDNFTTNIELKQKKFLPNYTFCAKVNNNGEAWVDTGIYPDSATTIELYLSNDNSTAQTGYYPKYVGNSGLKFTKYSGDGTRAYCEYGDGHSGPFSFPIGTEGKLVIENTGFTFNISSGGTIRGQFTVASFTATGDTIHIGDEYCNATFGRCVIKKGGNVVGDFMPCVYGAEAGFYDNVSQTFKGNSGSGTGFTAIDEYGNIMFSTDPVEALMIGSEAIKICYLGEKPIYAPAPFIGFQMTSTAHLGTDSGSTDTIRIKSSENWTLSIPNDCTWLSASTLSGAAGTSNVTLTATEANTAQTRTVSITATTANYSATCLVTQYYVQYVEWVSKDPIGDYQEVTTYNIDTGIYPTSATTFRVKGETKGNRCGGVIVGYVNSNDNTDWRLFWYGDVGVNLCFDYNRNRLQNSNWGNAYDGREIDFTCTNYSIYDNNTSAYLVTGSQQTANPGEHCTIKVDVGTWLLKGLEIWEGQTKVFDGKAAVYGGNIGLYDSITNTLKYNSALTMTYQAITPPQPTGITGTITLTQGDWYYDQEAISWAIDVSASVSATGVQQYGIVYRYIDDFSYSYETQVGIDPSEYNPEEYYESISDTTEEAICIRSVCDDGNTNFFKVYAYLWDETNDEVITSISSETTVYLSGLTQVDPVIIECFDCGGSGIYEGVMCDLCQGTGMLEFHPDCQAYPYGNENDEPCGCCQGTGVSSEWDEEEQTYIDVECPCCGGTGIDPGGGDEPEGEPVE